MYISGRLFYFQHKGQKMGVQNLLGSTAFGALSAIDEGILVTRTQDVAPILDDVAARRSDGLVGSSEMRHVARVPTVVLEGACNDAGVDMSDRDAVREIIFQKVSSGEWSKFQVHAGGY